MMVILLAAATIGMMTATYESMPIVRPCSVVCPPKLPGKLHQISYYPWINQQSYIDHKVMLLSKSQRKKSWKRPVLWVLLTSKYSGGEPESFVRERIKISRWWPNIECWLGSFVILQGIRREGIKISLKAGHNWPASKMPFKWCFASRPMMNLAW